MSMSYRMADNNGTQNTKTRRRTEKPLTILRKRKKISDEACKLASTILSKREMKMRISMFVDVRMMFTFSQRAFMDEKAMDRIRLSIRENMDCFKTTYSVLYQRSVQAVNSQLAEYDRKVHALLACYNFIRHHSIVINLINVPKDVFGQPVPNTSPLFGTITKIVRDRNNVICVHTLTQTGDTMVFKDNHEIPRYMSPRFRMTFYHLKGYDMHTRYIYSYHQQVDLYDICV